PLITGHEGAGIVEAVGAKVTGVEVGDHVLLSYASCGHCRACLRHEPYYCERFMELNFIGADQKMPCGHDADGQRVGTNWFGQSAFATHSLVNARSAVVIDKSLPLAELCAMGCGVQTGAGTVMNVFKMSAGQSLVVFGTGTVGLSAVMAAKAAGAAAIAVVDLHDNRLALASELGATLCFKAGSEQLGTGILAALPGGADYALDTSGRPDVIPVALSLLRLGGVCAQVGGGAENLTVPPHLLNGRVLTRIVEGNSDPQVFIPRLIELWRDGSLPLGKLMRSFSLAEINEAEQSSLNGAVVKPVIVLA
ncbi:MAG: aryl-alcohol dehydrogenase, partial [Alphaproteobacteria bacterium]|nr:aryl-alcohol dehydrogenase [Alphaproteobacteria bacterium]